MRTWQIVRFVPYKSACQLILYCIVYTCRQLAPVAALRNFLVHNVLHILECPSHCIYLSAEVAGVHQQFAYLLTVLMAQWMT